MAGEPDGGPGTQVVQQRAAKRGGPLIGSPASAARRLRALPFLRAGEAASEFTNVASGDQLARGGVTAWRHGPVIAGCAAAPYPPPRVLAPEPLKLGILVVPASAGGHRVSRQAAGGRAPGCGRGWARAGVASGLNAVGAAASPARSPGSAVPSRPGSRICGTAHGRTGRRRRSCPAEARRARRRAGRSGKTGMLPTETRSRALALHAPIQPGRSRFTGTACECRASPAPAQAGLVTRARLAVPGYRRPPTPG